MDNQRIIPNCCEFGFAYTHMISFYNLIISTLKSLKGGGHLSQHIERGNCILKKTLIYVLH